MRKVGGAAAGDHDAPAAALQHSRDDCSGAEVDPEHVDFEDVPPVGGVDLPGWLLVSVSPGVCDEEVDRAELGLDLLDHGIDRGAIADVPDDGKATDLTGGFFYLLPRASADFDASAPPAQLACDAPPQSASTAPDECGLGLPLPVGHRRQI